jgi:hypothetical protein
LGVRIEVHVNDLNFMIPEVLMGATQISLSGSNSQQLKNDDDNDNDVDTGRDVDADDDVDVVDIDDNENDDDNDHDDDHDDVRSTMHGSASSTAMSALSAQANGGHRRRRPPPPPPPHHHRRRRRRQQRPDLLNIELCAVETLRVRLSHEALRHMLEIYNMQLIDDANRSGDDLHSHFQYILVNRTELPIVYSQVCVCVSIMFLNQNILFLNIYGRQQQMLNQH